MQGRRAAQDAAGQPGDFARQGAAGQPDPYSEWDRGYSYPYPPFCRVFGWLISKGGWIRLDDLRVTLHHLSEWKARRLCESHGITVRVCNWHGDAEPCIRYEEGRRVMAAVRAREPP